MVMGFIKRQVRRAYENNPYVQSAERAADRSDRRAISEELGEITPERLEELNEYQRRFGMTSRQAAVYTGLAETAEGRAGDSQAVQDIEAEKSGLQAQVTGRAAAARDPFAAARNALAQRAGAELESAAQRQIASQVQAEKAQAEELMAQMRLGADIRREQLRLQREQQGSLLGGGIGSLLGAGLGAGLVALTGGAALPVYGMAAGTGGQLGGAFGRAISDKDMKSNVRDGNAEAKAMLDALSAKKYDKFGEEEVGIMAQDLEKSKAGDKMVEEVEGVKTIPKGFGEVLAAMANLNDRLSKLEKK